MRMKGNISANIFPVTLFVVLFCLGSSAKALDMANTAHIYFGGVPTSSSGYPLSVAISSVLKDKLGTDVTVEGSAGGVENLAYIQEDKIHFGISGNHSVYAAVRGEAPFKGKKYDKVRGWFPLYRALMYLVVKKDSPIKTWDDLKGKRISVGIKGGSIEKMHGQALAAIGLPRTAFKPYYLAHRETMEAMEVGTLDAGDVTGGLPFSTLIESVDTMPFRIISVPEDKLDYIGKHFPYYAPITVPANTYKGVPEARTFYLTTITLVHKDIPEEFMYKATKAIWENLERLRSASAAARDITPETLVNGVAKVLTIHPGALRYYREKGFVK